MNRLKIVTVLEVLVKLFEFPPQLFVRRPGKWSCHGEPSRLVGTVLGRRAGNGSGVARHVQAKQGDGEKKTEHAEVSRFETEGIF